MLSFRIYSSFSYPTRSIFGRTCTEFQSKYLQWNCTSSDKGQGCMIGGSGGDWPQLFTKLLLYDLYHNAWRGKSNEKSMSWPCKQHAILRYTYRYLGILRPADTLGYLVRYSWPPRPAQLLNKAKWPQAAALRHTHTMWNAACSCWII